MPELSDTAGYIVLAEDNPADVYLVRNALTGQEIGCDLKVFSDGEKVVQFFAELDAMPSLPCPRLLLLDLHLPRRDGKAVLEHLRGSERCSRTPVLLLTSAESAQQMDTAAADAPLSYFQKPSSIQQFMMLGQVVKDLLNRSSVS